MSATRAAGFDPGDVLLTGMNRRPADLERALDRGVRYVLVDNATELSKVREAGEVDLVRERETCEDVLGADRVPADLAERKD